jgi:hypothetical protein
VFAGSEGKRVPLASSQESDHKSLRIMPKPKGAYTSHPFVFLDCVSLEKVYRRDISRKVIPFQFHRQRRKESEKGKG